MIDLGTLSGNFGQADWVNERGDVVGVSSSPTEKRELFCGPTTV
jgi:hypothetical protein